MQPLMHPREESMFEFARVCSLVATGNESLEIDGFRAKGVR